MMDGVKSPSMNFQDNWLPNIIVSVVRDVVAFVGARWLLPRLPALRRFLAAQVARVRAWLAVRTKVARVSAFLRSRLPVRKSDMQIRGIALGNATARGTLALSGAGVSATVGSGNLTVTQALPPLPTFMNNSHVIQRDAYERQRAMAVHFAMGHHQRARVEHFAAQPMMADDELAFPAS
jgi:hypothetical protein